MEEKYGNCLNSETQKEQQEGNQELLSLGVNDIELILMDQADLYSEEELSLLRDRLAALRTEETRQKNIKAIEQLDPSRQEVMDRLAARGAEKKVQKQNSDVIKCPKCDGENPSSNKRCQYCSHSLTEQPKDSDRVTNKGLFFIAVLVPIVGVIMGLIYIGKNKDKLGKNLIIASIISVVVSAVIIMLVGWISISGGFAGIQRDCHYCGDVISETPVKASGRYYCSDDCLYREMFFGENSGY